MATLTAYTRCLHGLAAAFCALCHPPARARHHQVVQRQRVRSRRLSGLPSMRQWRTFVESLPLEAQRLCKLCRLPLPLFSTVHRVGVHDGYRLEHGDRIVLGAFVRVAEKVTEVLVTDEVVETFVDKVVPMYVSGTGCSICLGVMQAAEARKADEFAAAEAAFHAMMANKWRRPHVIAMGTTPSKRKAFIDVTEMVIEL